jgi:hypothetical protein
VLVTLLKGGQRARVLQLPVSSKPADSVRSVEPDRELAI